MVRNTGVRPNRKGRACGAQKGQHRLRQVFGGLLRMEDFRYHPGCVSTRRHRERPSRSPVSNRGRLHGAGKGLRPRPVAQ